MVDPLPFDRTDAELELEETIKKFESLLAQAEAQVRMGEWILEMHKPEPQKLRPLSFWEKLRAVFKRKAKRDEDVKS